MAKCFSFTLLLACFIAIIFGIQETTDPSEINSEPEIKNKNGIVIFSQPLPLPLWNNQQILFYFGLYSGLTNQRITLLNAAFFARMTGMKIILPQWKFDFSDYIGFSFI